MRWGPRLALLLGPALLMPGRAPLPLPAWVEAALLDPARPQRPEGGRSRSFTARAQADRGELVLQWEACSPRDNQHVAGVVRVDAQSGKLDCQTAAPATPPERTL